MGPEKIKNIIREEMQLNFRKNDILDRIIKNPNLIKNYQNQLEPIDYIDLLNELPSMLELIISTIIKNASWEAMLMLDAHFPEYRKHFGGFYEILDDPKIIEDALKSISSHSKRKWVLDNMSDHLKSTLESSGSSVEYYKKRFS